VQVPGLPVQLALNVHTFILSGAHVVAGTLVQSATRVAQLHVPQCAASFGVIVYCVDVEHDPPLSHDMNVLSQSLLLPPSQNGDPRPQFVDDVATVTDPEPVQTEPDAIFPDCLPQAPALLQLGPGPDLVHELSQVSQPALHWPNGSVPLAAFWHDGVAAPKHPWQGVGHELWTPFLYVLAGQELLEPSQYISLSHAPVWPLQIVDEGSLESPGHT
jgi:hypothetical protein